MPNVNVKSSEENAVVILSSINHKIATSMGGEPEMNFLCCPCCSSGEIFGSDCLSLEAVFLIRDFFPRRTPEASCSGYARPFISMVW